ncbi:MAG: hypothetical protein ACYS67_09565 [Planctomycetota bacterium]
MASVWRRFILRPISNWFDGADAFFTKIRAWGLKRQVLGTATDKMIELLLKGMDLFFFVTWDEEFRRHLKNFDGRYYFKTATETVKVSATFSNGDMQVHEDAIDDWDVMVTFRDGKALRRFIFSEEQDIFESLSENAVEVDGSLNHIFKFGYMARDLTHRLGIN